MRTTKQLGIEGENQAVLYLKSLGMEILNRNCISPFGEIDIIAKSSHVTHFVEVKTRSTRNFGLGSNAISSKKLQRMIRSAQWYLTDHQKLDASFQIDVISLDGGKISYLPNVSF